MKYLLLALCALPVLAALSACSAEEVEAKTAELESAAEGALAEFESLSLDKAKEKLQALSTRVTKQLAAVKDGPTAERAKQQLEPTVAALGKLKSALGEKMERLPSMEAVKLELEKFRDEFANNEAVMNVLQPLIDKLQNLLS